MATAEDGSFKPNIRHSKLALTTKAAMAGYIYACEYCEMRFQSMKYLKEHQGKCRAELVKEDSATEILNCEFCHREFTCAAFAKTHMRYCDKSAQMQKGQCCYCKNEYTLEELPTHKFSCSAKKESFIYTCSFCGFKAENAVDQRAHTEKCRALRSLSYAPKQVLHKCKACGKLFQGKENFIKHAAGCSQSKVDRKKPSPPLPRRGVVSKPPVETPAEEQSAVGSSTFRKRPHSIKKNSDGSMVIVIGERESVNNQGQVCEIVKKARLASPEGVGRSSIVIDLRGKKLIDDPDERKENYTNNNSRKETKNQQTLESGRPATVEKVYPCPYCKIPYDSKNHLARHLKTCYLGKQRYSVKCTHCAEDCADLQARTAHEKICRSKVRANFQTINQADMWDEPLSVALQSPEKTSQSAATPQQQHVTPTPDPVSAPASEGVPSTESVTAKEKESSSAVVNTIEKPFPCDYCKVPYENQHLMLRHMKSCYLGNERYSLKCSFCTLEFAELQSRMAHEKTCTARTKPRRSAAGDIASANSAPPAVDNDYVPSAGNVPAVVETEVGDAFDSIGDISKNASSDVQPQSNKSFLGHKTDENLDDEPKKVSEDSTSKSSMPVRFGQQKYKCDICGMEGFQQESSLMMHKSFCSWVSQQKVKIMPEKKSGSGLSVSARTSDELFNETIKKVKYSDHHIREKDPRSDVTSEVSCEGIEDSVESDVNDNFSEDEDGGAGTQRLMFVDGAVDSDDEISTKTRPRRSSKKFERMSDSFKSVGGHVRRGTSVERGKGKVKMSGKNANNNEDSKDTSKSEVVCQCGEKFGNKEALKAHLRNCQSSKGSADKLKTVKCKNCKKELKASSIAGHLKVCQKTCLKCRRLFGNVGAVIIHQRACVGKGKAQKKKKDDNKTKSGTESCTPKTKKVSDNKAVEKKPVNGEQGDKRDDLKCPKCSAIFGNEGGLGRHKLTCHGLLVNMSKSEKAREKARRTCTHCKSVFKSRKSALRHQKTCSRNTSACKKGVKTGQGKTKTSFLCGKCKRYFGNAGALAFHKYSCRGKVEASKTVFQGSAGSVVCPKCNRRFGNVGALGAHKKFCILPKKGKKSVKAEVGADQSGGDFECEYCKKKYASLQALAGHIGFCRYNNVAKPKEMPYTCQKCKRGFLSTQSLAVHVKHQMCGKPQTAVKKSPTKSTNKENKCYKCQRTFGSPGALGFHFKTCQGKKPVKFKCKYCSTVSKDAKTYTAHVKVCKAKKGASLYVTCEFCKTRFPNMQSLGGHKRFCSHRTKPVDEKKESGIPLLKYSCKLCGMKTKTIGGLTYHMVYFCKKNKSGKIIKGGKHPATKLPSKKNGVDQSPSKGEVLCRYCGKTFGNTGALGSHVRFCRMKGDLAMKSPSDGKINLIKNASKEFKNDVHVVYVFICPQCGVKFDNKAQLLQHFVACLDSDEDPKVDLKDQAVVEPQPGTSGVEMSINLEEKEDSVLPGLVEKLETKETVPERVDGTSRYVTAKQAVGIEPCKDCDWAALSARDNDIVCHKKYCLYSKHSAATMPKTQDSNRNNVICDICGMEFKSKECLSVHFKFCKWVKDHKIISNLPEPEGNSDSAEDNETAEDTGPKFAKNVLVPNFVSATDSNDTVVYKCEYCGRTSNNKGAVINHVRYCVHRPKHFLSPNKEPTAHSGTTVIDLSHLSVQKT